MYNARGLYKISGHLRELYSKGLYESFCKSLKHFYVAILMHFLQFGCIFIDGLICELGKN